jgi:MSHA biogenesis protein MshP
MNPKSQLSMSFKKQQGFLLPLAIFLLVIVGGFIVLMNKSITQASNSFLLNIYSQQAKHASAMGAQLALNQLVFPSTDRRGADQRCINLSINQVFAVDGLEQCQLTISCGCRYNTDGICNVLENNNYSGANSVDSSYYLVSSQASCGSGVFRSEITSELNSKFTP